MQRKSKSRKLTPLAGGLAVLVLNALVEAQQPATPPQAGRGAGAGRAGNLVFDSDGSGNFIAFDARSGEPLWHAGFLSNPGNPPITYVLDRHQYVLTAGVENMYAFRLQ